MTNTCTGFYNVDTAVCNHTIDKPCTAARYDNINNTAEFAHHNDGVAINEINELNCTFGNAGTVGSLLKDRNNALVGVDCLTAAAQDTSIA